MMVTTRLYKAEQSEGKQPIIVGLPGMVHESERTRIDHLLSHFAENGINGLRLSFSGINSENEGKRIVCNYNLPNFIKDLTEAVSQAASYDFVNPSRIGVLTSSISAGVFAHYLAQQNNSRTNPEIKCFASLSPALGGPYFIDTKRDSDSKNKGPALQERDISSEYDIQNGRQRVLPIAGLMEIVKTDGIRVLSKYQPNGMKTMTLVGQKDAITQPASMIQFHSILGGSPENLVIYDCGHDIHTSLCEDPLTKFFKSNL